jgi:hypothetical protein
MSRLWVLGLVIDILVNAAVRWTAVAANLSGLLLAVGFSILTGLSGAQGPLLIALFLTGARIGRCGPAEAEQLSPRGLGHPLARELGIESEAGGHVSSFSATACCNNTPTLLANFVAQLAPNSS